MVNGDGNANMVATSYNLTILDSSTSAGTLIRLAWISFIAKWKNPYVFMHMLTREAGVIVVMDLNSGSVNQSYNLV